MINKTKMATWVLAVIWRAFWLLIIGGTISFLLARNGQGLPAIIALTVTIVVAVGYIAARTWRLARTINRAQQKRSQRLSQ